ncbi:MAG: MotA/TolQ/ExbB proton channel family protein [Sphingobacteriia bacterium]|nr:MotA/TolQ/ExbB proton channel family protein [Sphingobacteriia bacterium]NCC41095.1 MotA/TolQ/ExbB proton channel family protein [Gammaproteobacteria bacterium]
MLEILTAGGWLMIPILACSILATGLAIERAWTLRRARIMPPNLVNLVLEWQREGQLSTERITAIRVGSPLGRLLAAGLINRDHPREIMKESIEETGRQVVAELERFLDTLATIASVAPLLGLLGTVLGMIEVFDAILEAGVGNAAVLAGGISKALITTAAGLAVAIPALILHRWLDGKVARLALDMEEQALRLVELIKGEREADESLP